MRIINTFDKIPGCFKNSAFDLDAWRVYARAISPELGEKCERDSREYDFNNDVLPVVNNVLLNRDAAIAANDSFVAVTDKLASNIERLLKTASRRILFSIWGCATARAGRHRLTAETRFCSE